MLIKLGLALFALISCKEIVIDLNWKETLTVKHYLTELIALQFFIGNQVILNQLHYNVPS